MLRSGGAVDLSGSSVHPLGGVCVVGELASTGLAGGAVLRRSGWFDAGLIHSSAEDAWKQFDGPAFTGQRQDLLR